LNSDIIIKTEKQDGIFILNTDLSERVIKKEQIIDSYKNLREVEDLFDDFKNFVDVNPVRHWKEKRVRSHVFICILSLLLKRVFEIDSYKSKAVMIPLEEVSKLKLMICQVNDEETFKTITVPSSIQSNIFKLIGIKNPTSLHKFL
jgi:transposase